MLKIKENVDLEESKKYGFEYNDDCGIYFYRERNIEGITQISINSWNKHIILLIANRKDKKVLNILYDLIKDGLVEKVEQ